MKITLNPPRSKQNRTLQQKGKTRIVPSARGEVMITMTVGSRTTTTTTTTATTIGNMGRRITSIINRRIQCVITVARKATYQ